MDIACSRMQPRERHKPSNAAVADVWVLQEIEPPIEFSDLSGSSSAQPLTANHVGGSTPLINHKEFPITNCNNNQEDPHSSGGKSLIPIHGLASPFMGILRVGGLYFELEDGVPQTRKSKSTSSHLLQRDVRNGPYYAGKPKRKSIMSRMFLRGSKPSESLSFSVCSFSLIIAAIDDARLIYAFYALWAAGQLTSLAFVVDNLVTIIWAMQCLVVHCILMCMCYQRRFAELFDAWEDLRTTYPDPPNAFHTPKFNFNQRFRSKQKLLIITAFLALTLNCYSLIGPLLIPLDVYKDFQEYIMFPFSVDNIVVKLLIVTAFVFRSFDYVFAATLFLLLSDAIVLQFTQFYRSLAVQISKEGIMADASMLEWYRLKHTKLCTLVERVDAIFSPYVLIGLASGMFGLLAQVYVIYDFLKRGDMGVITVLSYVYFCLLNLAQVLVILWCGSKVNVAALLPLSKLYEIDQRSLSVQEIQHLTVFLQKLSGCQTGYTALGIFTIDMTTILSLAGFYFTYQILLFQMRNDSSLDTRLANIALPPDILTGLRAFLNSTMQQQSPPAEAADGALLPTDDVLNGPNDTSSQP